MRILCVTKFVVGQYLRKFIIAIMCPFLTVLYSSRFTRIHTRADFKLVSIHKMTIKVKLTLDQATKPLPSSFTPGKDPVPIV